MKRWAAAVAAFITCAAPSVAEAKYRGTDVWSQIAPSTTQSGLANHYPLSYFALDYHVEGPHVGVPVLGGGVGAGDIPAIIAQFLSSLIWQITSWMVNLVISIFDWAFSVDLLNGAQGALAPISNATQNLYGSSTIQALIVAAIILAGLWAMHRGLVQRRFGDAASGIALSVLMVAVALLFILRPEATIGRMSQLTNSMSATLLSSGTNGTQGTAKAEDHLFQTFVVNPWTVLEFGGMEHCVSSEKDDDGFPKPVAPSDPKRVTCIDHVTAHGGVGGYVPQFLSASPGSDERDQMYEALKNGESNDKWPDWRITRADAPGVDIQQADGALQRLALAVLISVGALGAILLLGMLAFAALIAQVIALALLAFAPVALLAGVTPWGHKLFRGWLSKLGLALFVKVIYTLVLAVLIGVSAALDAATGSISYLFAFALQATFFWIVFLKRKALANILLSHRETTRIERTTREAIATPVMTAAGVGWAGGVAAARRMRNRDGEEETDYQEHVPRPDRTNAPVPAEQEVVATVARPTAPSAPAPAPAQEDAERVVVAPAEPSRSRPEDLTAALDAANEQPSSPGAPARPAPQEGTSRPTGHGHMPARPEPPERVQRPNQEDA